MLARLVALALALMQTPAFAGPVNVDKLSAGQDREGLATSASVAIALGRGNVERGELHLNGALDWRRHFAQRDPSRPPWLRIRVRVSANAHYGTAFGRTLYSRGLAHASAVHFWHRRVGTGGFAQIQYDEFLALQRRMILGLIAPTIIAVHRERLRLRFNTGYMLEFERNRITVPGDPHPAQVINHRNNTTMVIEIGLIEDRALTLRNLVDAQPRFDDPRDLRLLESVQLEGRISRNFAMGLDADLSWDSRPASASST